MILKREESILVAIDFQEKLMPAVKMNEELEKTVAKLIQGCKILDLPIIVSQQYTKGLGETIPSIKEVLGTFDPIEKTSFSCCGEETFIKALKETGKKSVIIAGIEAHICVQQTVLDLLELGYNVFLVNDCVGSRNNNDKKYAVRRMTESGAIGTTYESVLFELCRNAKADGFKEISKLVK
ncbi:MAG: hydrolase [Clostridia bacterium]|nr:hydrolase [Clostridia bacterium]